ncbi:hypothetical protein NHX12_032453 [Muraenolepis orangiensis]|uniref:Cyclin-F n=1 Tax=Muraenolepis orangiensis TaxID=630683 RepID=A0A9Q0E6C9_9TELE|nr:hypothetical protein NHX12_032453 [Muraenolepis orangiensis]
MSMLNQVEEAVKWCKAEQAKFHVNIQFYNDLLKSLTLQPPCASIDLDDAHEGAEEDVEPQEKEEIELVEQALREALRIRSSSSSTGASIGPRCSREPPRPNKVPGDKPTGVKPNDANQNSGTRKGKQEADTSSKNSGLARRETRQPGISSSSGARSKNVNHLGPYKGTIGGVSVRSHSASSSKVKHEKRTWVGCSPVDPGKARASVHRQERDEPPGKGGAPKVVAHVSLAGDAGTRSTPPQKRLWDNVMVMQSESVPERSAFMEKMGACFPRSWPRGSPDQTRALVDSLTRQGQNLSHCYQVQKLLAQHSSSSGTPPDSKELQCVTLEHLERMAADLRNDAAQAKQEWEAWDRWRPEEGGCLCPGEQGGQWVTGPPLLPPVVTVASEAELVELEKLSLRVVLLQQEVYLHQALSDSLSPQLPSLLCGPGPPDCTVLRDVYSLLAEGGELFPALVLDTEPGATDQEEPAGRSPRMGCAAGQLAQSHSTPGQDAQSLESGAPKVPEVLSSLERLSQATGGMEKSWYRCIFPFGIISLVMGVAGTGVTYAYNDLPQTKVVSLVLLMAGLVLVVMAGTCWTVHRKKRRNRKEGGSFSSERHVSHAAAPGPGQVTVRGVRNWAKDGNPTPQPKEEARRHQRPTSFARPCLSAEDLLAVRAVHSQLRDIVDNHSSVWARVSFRESWPDPKTVWLFERAAEKGNFEAAVKLGIAYLYNEGPLKCDDWQADVCGQKASHFFSLAEALHPATTDPFTWVFIRPPWSLVGSCCKAVVFKRLKAECEASEKKGPLLHSLARVLLFFDEEEMHAGALSMLKESSQAGCLQSSYLLWEQNCKAAMSDPGRYLQCMRTLRDYAAKGCWEAQLSLAKVCINGNPLGLEGKACVDLVAQFFSSTLHTPHHRATEVLRRGIKDTMRYILVDWLVEVTTMKALSSLTLQVTVGCVDRYLALRSVPKARLQLLGIACMVVCTRYTSKDILTIREAVWLTDNTYKYEDLVRMMGEVIAALEGKIRTPMLLDYGEVLLHLLPLEWRTKHLFKYVCELSLLHSTFAMPPPAKLACAVLLLARALHHYAPVWPRQLVEYTGFSKQDLTAYALQLYVKCFSPDVPKDYRHVSLTAVKQRFEDATYQQISQQKVVDFRELCQILEVPEVEPQMDPPSPAGSPADIHTFLSSPSSSNKRRRDDGMQDHRGTPTAELSTQEETLLGDILDWSLDTSSSGYEGDQEESEAEKDGETSVMTINLHKWSEAEDGLEHCRSLSSDENSFCEAERGEADRDGQGRARSKSRAPLPFSSDLQSSGYVSVHCSSSSPTGSSFSPLVPCTIKDLPGGGGGASSVDAVPGFRLLVPVQRPRGPSCRQVKRKNGAAHSGGEMKVEEEEEEEDMEREACSALTGFQSL